VGELQITRAGPNGEAHAHGHPYFYFSFDGPESYLAAERVLRVIDGPCEWVPVRPQHSSWVFRCAQEREIGEQQVEKTAADRGLQAVRWPPEFDQERVLLAATFAKSIGRTVSFALAALRQAYAGGADLGDENTILIAASACEMHPRAVLQALERPAVARALDEASAQAADRGVLSTPTVWQPDGTLLCGDDQLGEERE